MSAINAIVRRCNELAGVLFGVGAQVLFAITVWQIFWFLRAGAPHHPGPFVVADLLLCLQFAVVHSLLLLPRTRSAITQIIPSQLYGCFFTVVTCLGLLAIVNSWRGSSTVVWQAEGVAATAIRAGFYASWLGLIYSLALGGFGYHTGWTPFTYWLRNQTLPRREFTPRGIYHWLRHPVYLTTGALFWFTPRMTLDHAILTSTLTTYIFIGSYLKDRRLEFYLGDTYREYATRIPGYPFLFFGPLGSWSLPSNSTTPQSEQAVPWREVA
jgi:protein-S-isoprenylcysteine O-methyltransferase Ste14